MYNYLIFTLASKKNNLFIFIHYKLKKNEKNIFFSLCMPYISMYEM